jgi:shikimate kinase
MRIGLYGMPTAGKTHILDQLDFIEVVVGSRLLREYDPDFDSRDEAGREKDRKAVAQLMMAKETFIMDGHYAFGDEIAFTEDEGKMYDVYLYLYVSPDIIKERMAASDKNRKYLKYNIAEWQNTELAGLRKYCQENGKDFYVLDNPPDNYFEDVSRIIEFIREIVNGYSCATYAKECADYILKKSKSDTIVLLDGDKTLTIEDSSGTVFGYKTNLYDGNFYTGYQAWKQNEEFKQYTFDDLTEMPVHFNENVKNAITEDTYILTSGHERIWRFIAKQLGLDFFYGTQMSAETKLFITKHLQTAGKRVVAYGDGMNDYFMLKQADEGFLIAKRDGTISRSLKGRDTEGLIIV